MSAKEIPDRSSRWFFLSFGCLFTNWIYSYQQKQISVQFKHWESFGKFVQPLERENWPRVVLKILRDQKISPTGVGVWHHHDWINSWMNSDVNWVVSSSRQPDFVWNIQEWKIFRYWQRILVHNATRCNKLIEIHCNFFQQISRKKSATSPSEFCWSAFGLEGY